MNSVLQWIKNFFGFASPVDTLSAGAVVDPLPTDTVTFADLQESVVDQKLITDSLQTQIAELQKFTGVRDPIHTIGLQEFLRTMDVGKPKP